MERYTFNYEVMKDENGGKQLKNVWRMMPPSSEEKKLGKHPTQKPVSLVARCLRASTTPGELVIDPFAGSGTTGVAALQLGSNFQGCEHEEEYVRLAAKSRRRSSLFTPRMITPFLPARCWTPAASKSVGRIA